MVNPHWRTVKWRENSNSIKIISLQVYETNTKTNFVKLMSELCKKYNTCLIADEVQSGFGRTGDFFAFEKHKIKPDIIPVAKGMGNGFPVGGV